MAKKHYRSEVVKLVRSWEGLNEKDGSHKKIIDIYNNKMPGGKFPRGTKMQYNWSWCACTWSALAIQLGYTDIMPIEISVNYLVQRAKEMGIWQENDAYVPQIADAVIYDWNDNGVGDNTGYPDHIGTVVSVNKKAGLFEVTEGNYKDSVKSRVMKINGRYIRGFICPKYDAKTKPTKVTKEKQKAKPKQKAVEIDKAEKRDLEVSGTFQVKNDNVKLMSGAGDGKTAVCKLFKGTKLRCYGYYSEFNDVKWPLLQVTIKGVVYTGFCSGEDLKKVK